MKKRLLALALCLVMMTSLLPITAAAADYNLTYLEISASGVEKRGNYYYVKYTGWEAVCDDGSTLNGGNMPNYHILENPICTSDSFGYGTELTISPMENRSYYVLFQIRKNDNTSQDIFFSSNLSANLDIPGYTAEMLPDYNPGHNFISVRFKLTKGHDWKFTVSESGDKLTAECVNNDTPPVSVTLKADSVTLPNSPFNARLEGWEQFKAAIPLYADPVFNYKCDGEPVDKNTSNPKAGKYQAGVAFTNLPGTIVDEKGNPLNQAYLFTQYTAVDPKVTAQTGDNRPIELMLGSVLVFSALAAAFLLDNKRKYSR